MFDIDAVRQWTLDRWMQAVHDLHKHDIDVVMSCVGGRWSVSVTTSKSAKIRCGYGATLLLALIDFSERYHRAQVGEEVLV